MSDPTPPSFAPGDRRHGAQPVGVPYDAPPAPFAPGPAEPVGSPPSFVPRGAPEATAPPAPAPERPRRPPAPRPTPDGTPGAPGTVPGARKRRRHRWRWVVGTLVVLLVLTVAWPVGLVIWANGKIQKIDGLTLTGGGPGTTYLIAGSDERDGGIADDGITGPGRADTILLLHVPDHGTTSLISIPRDTYVDIPGHGPAKLNAATAYGGAPLLVQTVEQITGLKIDHYVEIGMGGVKDVVDAVGGVELCWDADVDDPDSGMVWTAGCHTVDGTQALAFSRMRKSDPTGDIGRGLRQRQVVGAVMHKVNPASLVVRPDRQVSLVDSGTAALRVDQGTSVVDLGRLALAFRTANGSGGVTGTPPIKSMNYRPGNVGSTVLLDPDASPAFWKAIADGTLPPGTVGGVPG